MHGLNIPTEISWACTTSVDAEKLLRSLGATAGLVGYNYMIHIVDAILASPDEHRYLTKSIYPETAKRFRATPESVEHAIRTLIRNCWKRADHSALDYIAGAHQERMPTNREFIYFLVSFIRSFETEE